MKLRLHIEVDNKMGVDFFEEKMVELILFVIGLWRSSREGMLMQRRFTIFLTCSIHLKVAAISIFSFK